MDDVLNSLAEKAAREAASWSSIELSVQVKLPRPVRSGLRGPVIDGFDYHYVETAEGKRFADEQDKAAEAIVNRRTGYCNGTRCATVTYDFRDHKNKQDNILVSNFFLNERSSGSTDRPQPLQYFYVGKVPLHEALPKGERVGTSKLLDRECEIVLFREVKWGAVPLNLFFHLDRATAVPLKIEFYHGGLPDQGGRQVGGWQAHSLDKTHGRHFPRNSDSYIIRDGKRVNEREIVVSRIEYDKAFDARMFWPKYEPGATIVDLIANKISRVPGGPVTKAPDQTGPAAGAPTVGVPAAAVPPSDWTSSIPAVSLMFGVVLLAASLLIWLRRR